MTKHSVLLLLLPLFAALPCAQAQKLMFNYQGVARDTNNQAFKNQKMEILVEIFEDDTLGNPAFEEIHNVRTSTLGVFNIKVGSDKNSDLGQIDWSSGKRFFLKTTITVGNGAPKTLSTAELAFVPMAIYANLADKASTLVGLKGGVGISILGNTITNTGVLLSTAFGGDVQGTYDNLQIQPKVVGTTELADSAVGNAQLARDAVTTKKIKDKDITTDDLDDGAVTTEKIKNNAIDNDKIADRSLNLGKLSGGTAAPGQVLKWNGISWAAGNDNDTPMTAGSGININGSLVSALDVSPTNEIQSLTWNGKDLGITNGTGVTLQAGGDVSGDLNNLQIQNGAITGPKLSGLMVIPNDQGLTFTGGPVYFNGSIKKDMTNIPFNYYGYNNVKFVRDGCSECTNINQKNVATDDYLSKTQSTRFDGALGTNKFTLPNLSEFDYSIIANTSIKAFEFHAVSDKRIKQGITTSDKQRDVISLNKLRVRDYVHTDNFTYGPNPKKGFIAQEVETVFPEAVSRTTDFIPNIYQLARKVQYNAAARTLTLAVDSIMGGLRAGDKVRIIADQQREVTVASVQGSTLTVQDWPVPTTTEAFVYGKQVNDFRVVDYDRIFTLNVSATQALIADVGGLSALVTDLQAQNAALKGQNVSLQTSVERIEARLQALTARLDGMVTGAKTEEK